MVRIESYTFLFDQPIQTDRNITANRPDIVVCVFHNRTCLVIDVAVPSDGNIIGKEAEKINTKIYQ